MKTAIVGIPIPGEVRATLEKALGGLDAGTPVAGENMHVAIADMGEQPDWMIDKLTDALEQVEVGRSTSRSRGSTPPAAPRPTRSLPG